jgi:hypothetical protein
LTPSQANAALTYGFDQIFVDTAQADDNNNNNLTLSVVIDGKVVNADSSVTIKVDNVDISLDLSRLRMVVQKPGHFHLAVSHLHLKRHQI